MYGFSRLRGDGGADGWRGAFAHADHATWLYPVCRARYHWKLVALLPTPPEYLRPSLSTPRLAQEQALRISLGYSANHFLSARIESHSRKKV
jgi:hypothetical protein